MPEKSTGIIAKKPKTMLQQQLAINSRDLAVALAKAVGHIFIGKFDELTNDGVEAFSALGLEKDNPESLAYILLEKALQAALSSLLADSKEYLPSILNSEKLIGPIGDKISKTQVDLNFFIRPDQVPILIDVSHAIRDWLEGEGVDPKISKTISQRLPGYFPYALHREWQANPSLYEKIYFHLNTPFAKASERETAWSAYAARLEKMLDISVFDEPYGLRQVYIRLNGYYEEDVIQKNLEIDNPVVHSRQRVVVDLSDELDSWLNNGDKEDAIRAISGGPGSGKSSFAKMYAVHIVKQGRFKVLFCPLHLIDATKDFSEEIGRFVLEQGILTYNPLASDNLESNLLIILDGLDELASQGKAAEATARDFIRAVQQLTIRRNSQELRLHVLFCGREVVMQEGQSEFRSERQLLTVLPYFVDRREEQILSLGYIYKDPGNLLCRDLRDQWWANYAQLTGQSFKDMPKELHRLDLREITKQPLLNYLLALSYCRGKLNFSSEVNLNQIYYDLVEAVYERGYENGRKHISVQGMMRNDFFKMLEEIGLAAWHGDGRTTTVSEIEKQCRAGGLERQLNTFREGAKQGVTRLLAAFFFRQQGERPQGDPTFVFTHKSFGEYLAARRLVHAIEEIIEERERRISKGGNKGWSEVDALYHWVKWCGPTAMSPYIYRFIVAEISLYDFEVIRVWQYHLSILFSYSLNNCMPMEMMHLPTFQDAIFQSRNAEESLLAALNACSAKTREISEISMDSQTSIGTWIKRIQPQRDGTHSCLALKCLSRLDLSGSILHAADLADSDLSYSNLSGVAAIGVNFSQAILDSANLTNAYFPVSNFQDASLMGSDLSNAYIKNSSLSRAQFVNANLTKVFLENCNMVEADLREANCVEASFINSMLNSAKFTNSNVSKANFQDTKLDKANFEGADASRAFFLRASAIKCNFNKCNLSHANLNNANISFACFDYSILKSTDFRMSNIFKARFNNSIFYKIITENAELKAIALQGQ